MTEMASLSGPYYAFLAVLMLETLFRCPNCGRFSNFRSPPLCDRCHSNLRKSPSLCDGCGQLPGSSLCCLPWRRNNLIQSYHAHYLLTERCYSVLKKWKGQSGTLFDRLILSFTHDSPSVQELMNRSSFDFILPIPQRIERSWQLRRSPALSIATRLGRLLQTPLETNLLLPDLNREKRQAQLRFEERFEKPVSFQVNWKTVQELTSLSERTPRSVVLVDDFRTSGETLLSAAQLLRSILPLEEVHVFTLGFRPALQRSE